MDISTSDEFIRDLVKRAEDIYLGRHQGGCKNFIPDMVQAVGGMNELTKLWLDSCSEMECFIDASFGPFQVDIVLPKLVKLILENMDNLREVCHGPPLHCFLENLEEFHIKRNVKLHIIFPRECNLGNLKILRIEHCPKLMTSLFPMSAARTLVLLQELTVKKCSKLKHIIINDGAEIIPDNSSLMFPKLKIISVRSCHKLECIFSIYCAQGLVQLEEIRIAGASELKYVFSQLDNESHLSNQIDIELPLLKVLKLQDLKNLLSICPENYQSRWPSLTELHWVNCPKLTFSCMNVMAGLELRKPHPDKGHLVAEKNGSQLSNEVPAPSPAILKVKNVDIQNCGVVNIFHLQGLGPGEDQQECMASRLVRLRLENLHELRFVGTGLSGTQILTLQNLQHLEVYRCGKLKSIFSHVVYRISLPRLTRLIVSDCEELEEIIAENEEPQNLSSAQVCFPKLRVLRIQRCNKLKSLFSSAMGSMLPQLKFLCILEAVELEQVFKGRSEGSTNSGEEIFLPNLREIELRKLPSLIEFFQGFRFHSVKLQKVLISDCPKLASISGASQVISFHQGTEGVQEDGINGSQSSDDVPALLPADLNAYELEIKKCLAVKLFYPLGLESTASKLVRLHLYNLAELTLIWTGSKHFLSLHHLEYLKVNHCRKLQSVFCAVVHGSLPKLTNLLISGCEELEEIIADNEDTQNLPNAEVCFPKLTWLSVNTCHKLKSLFSTSMARMLPQLTYLHIEDADQLEEIFGRRIEDNTSNREKIVLPNLRNIKLKQLPSLVDICQAFKVHAVDLHKVNIDECPKFTPILGATQLISLHQSKEELEVLMTADGEVSHEISALQAILNVKKKIPIADEAGKIMTSDLETLCLKHLPDLMFIWNGPILISFQNLYSLDVTGCRKLKSIFSASVIRCLPKLNSLDINDCEELEKIISEGDGEPSNSHPDQLVCFPKLRWIHVQRCSKLKFLFSFFFAADFPELRMLKIQFCSQLEQVFSWVHENYHRELEFGLAKLRSLTLEGLPGLANICPGLDSELQLQALHCCEVKDCPNFCSSTIPALHKFMGAHQSQNTDDKEKEEQPEQKQEVDEELSLHDDGGDLLDNENKDEDGAEDEDGDNDEEDGDEDNNKESSEEEDDDDSDLDGFLSSKYYDSEDA